MAARSVPALSLCVLALVVSRCTCPGAGAFLLECRAPDDCPLGQACGDDGVCFVVETGAVGEGEGEGAEGEGEGGEGEGEGEGGEGEGGEGEGEGEGGEGEGAEGEGAEGEGEGGAGEGEGE